VVDPESGVGSSHGCNATAIVADTAGTTLTCTASSVGGTASASVTIKRDATAPQVSITAPADGAVFTLNQAVMASFDCSDADSGVATCVGPVIVGEAVDTTLIGTRTFTVLATDAAGNSTSVSREYTVRYQMVGFLAPVDNLPTVNAATAGKVIPVKWQLQDSSGVFVDSLTSFKSLGSVAVACTPGVPVDDIEEVVATGGTALRYDTAANQFVYNWSTTSKWKSSCRKLVLELSDGQKKEAMFRFK
jgi:hypothetical protein